MLTSHRLVLNWVVVSDNETTSMEELLSTFKNPCSALRHAGIFIPIEFGRLLTCTDTLAFRTPTCVVLLAEDIEVGLGLL